VRADGAAQQPHQHAAMIEVKFNGSREAKAYQVVLELDIKHTAGVNAPRPLRWADELSNS
jgi:hypothetical protein